MGLRLRDFMGEPVRAEYISARDKIVEDSWAYYGNMNRSTRTEVGEAFASTFEAHRKKGPFEVDDALIKGFGLFLRPEGEANIGRAILTQVADTFSGVDTPLKLVVVDEGQGRQALVLRFAPDKSMTETQVREHLDAIRDRIIETFNAFDTYFDDFEWAVYFDTEDELY